MNVPAVIDKALKAGARLHAFRSGGGLRVVRLEVGGKLVGYGEHPEARVALAHAAEDYLAGGRPYSEVYGPDSKHTHYLTGSSTPSGDLDAWLLRGNTFDAWRDLDETVFQLKGHGETKHPEDILERAKTGPVTWESRGFVFKSSPSMFPNMKPCVSTEVVSSPQGREKYVDAWFYTVTKTGRGPDLETATADALLAPELEFIEACPAERSDA